MSIFEGIPAANIDAGEAYGDAFASPPPKRYYWGEHTLEINEDLQTPASRQPVEALMLELGVMKEVGCDAGNPPPIEEVLPQIAEKLEATTSLTEHSRLLVLYRQWVGVIYGIDILE